MEIFKFFTNEELLDRYAEIYRKYKQLNSSPKNKALLQALKAEILKRMENEK